jgi:hypothetical protein
VDRASFANWIKGYEAAWRTPGTQALRGLFSDDATYRTAPFEPPFQGLAAIEEMWESERDGPDEAFEMDFELVAVEGEVAVARVDVRYGDPATLRYLDLWVIRLGPDGHCREFEEWPFWPSEARGTYVPGPSDE